MTEPHDKLTTDPPRPPGTPDVDDLVGDPIPTGEQRTEPDHGNAVEEDGTGDTVSVDPSD